MPVIKYGETEYQGEMKDGKREGMGILKYADGTIY